MTTKQLVKKITQLIFEKKGSDVKVIELMTVSTIADYFIICSADSDTQVRAIADNIDKSLRDEGVRLWHKEGTLALQWVLLDYVDIVIHVFQKDIRAFYNLEKLWGDAPIVAVQDKPKKISAAKTKTVKTKVKPETKKVETKPAKTRTVKPKVEKTEAEPKKVRAVKPKTKKTETKGAIG